MQPLTLSVVLATLQEIRDRRGRATGTLDDLRAALPRKFPARGVRAAMEGLLREGVISGTVEDEHFDVTIRVA